MEAAAVSLGTTPHRTPRILRPAHYSVTGEPHWASVYVAREHRLGEFALNGTWTCPCVDCAAVRKQLASQTSEVSS